MTDEPIAKRKPGRPRKDGKPPGSRPACEKDELAKYPNPGKWVAWGVEPECKRFKRKGMAVLYNREHPGGQVTLMPVTDDGGELRWRYRFIKGYCPYRYEKQDLEPGQAAKLSTILREVADTIDGLIIESFGGVKEADKTTEDFHAEKRGDRLGELIKKENVF